tara:strand:+ start:385 stop:528 length:144 start_codon:yes stop_codon:yes gene_type:complete
MKRDSLKDCWHEKTKLRLYFSYHGGALLENRYGYVKRVPLSRLVEDE